MSEAKKGNPKACFLLGVSYEHGIGLERDETKAKKWYEKAHNMGEIHSIYNLYYN